VGRKYKDNNDNIYSIRIKKYYVIERRRKAKLMKKTLKLIIISFFLLNIFVIKNETLKANNSMWVSLGRNYPCSEVRAIAIDNNDPNLIYLGTRGEGIFKTINGGEFWTPINNNLTNTYVNSIIIDPKNENIIYAGTAVGIYKSIDGGDEWNEKDNGLGGLEVLSLSVDPQDSKLIYAGIFNEGSEESIEGIFKSSNGGENWENIGLKDETIFSIAIKPDNPSVIYVSTWFGIFKSSDHGNSWVKIGLDQIKVDILKIDPQNTSIIYASTNNGVYKSSDAGISWVQIGFPGTEVLSLAIDPYETKIIYCGTNIGRLYKSVDYGDSWKELRIVSSAIISIEIDYNGTVYVGKEDGISKSIDGGRSFKTISNPRGIEALAIDPTKRNTIYSATFDGVFKSEDDTISWKRIGLDNVECLSIAIDNKNPKIIYVGTSEEGVYRSIDSGTTWQNTSQGLLDPYGEPSVFSLVINPDNTKVIYAGTFNGVFKSIDGGSSWQEVGPKANSGGGLWVLNIQIDSFDHKILYIGTNSGVFESTDEGLSWDSIGLIGVFVSTLAVSPKDSNIIFAGTYSDGLFKSSDGGKSWRNMAISDPKYYKYYNFYSIAIYPANPETIFAIGSFNFNVPVPSPVSFVNIKFPVYLKSSDNGVSWKRQDIPNTIPYIYSMFLDETSDIVYLGTAIGVLKVDIKTGKGAFNSFGFPNNYVETILAVKEILYAGSSDGAIGKSIDEGSTWQYTAQYSNLIHSFSVDPSNLSIIYACTSIGILQSLDGGIFWNKLGFIYYNTYSIVIDKENTNIIYAGTENGVLKSEDGGENWENIGLLGDLVLQLVINPKKPSIIYAATSAGIFKSTDSGESWILKKASNENINVITLENPNIVYAGTENGVLKSIDGGENWEESGIKGARVFCIAIDPQGNVFVGTDSGVFLSENSGYDWVPINNGLTNFYIYSIAIDCNGNIYVGTDGGGIFKYATECDINASANAGGQISPSGTVNCKPGVSQTFSFSPNKGYKISDVKVDGKSIGPVSSYTFANITQDHTIEAIFEPLTYTITTSSSYGGSISPTGTVSANYGDSKTFAITPYSGYKISTAKVDGKSIGSVSSYTFTNITQDHTIEALFEKEKKETIIILQIGNKNFTVNGETRTLDSPPVIKNNRTLLPIRAVVEALGGTVGWDATERKVTITLSSTTIELWIGKSTAKVNGINTPIDATNPKVVPEIINGRTMLPLRFVTENLGCTVDWDGTTQTITITYQP